MISTHIVILGTGFGGFTVARTLERSRDRLRTHVTVVDRANYMLFTPMLPEVSSGAVEPRHIAQPLRVALQHSLFELGEITGVDFNKRVVELQHPIDNRSIVLEYDQLVIALGATTSTHGIPGAEDHSFPLKTLDD
ncbi:MAG: FAD-dependent oxidoreductase, partial [Candidatus Tumulicola sp.]